MGLGKGCPPLLSYYPIGQYDCFALKRQTVSRIVGPIPVLFISVTAHYTPFIHAHTAPAAFRAEVQQRTAYILEFASIQLK